MNRVTQTLKYIFLVILASTIGFFIRGYFFDFSLYQIAEENINFVSHNLREPFYSNILISIFIGLIPVLYLLIKKVTKINFIYRGLISLFLIVTTGILFWELKIFLIRQYIRQLLGTETTDPLIPLDLNFYKLNFEYNLFAGFIAGTLLSIFIFKKKKQ